MITQVTMDHWNHPTNNVHQRFTEFQLRRQWSNWLEEWCHFCPCNDPCVPQSAEYIKHIGRHSTLCSIRITVKNLLAMHAV